MKPATREAQSPDLVQGLGLVSSITIVMGSMIGSGIFIVSADIARQVQSPGLLIVTWGLTAFMTIVGALSYGELAAAMPRAGGQYVYLREALGPLFGFLYGWTMFLVIQTGTIAAVAVAFARFLEVLVPSVSSTNYLFELGTLTVLGKSIPLALSTQQLVAIGSLAVLTTVNCSLCFLCFILLFLIHRMPKNAAIKTEKMNERIPSVASTNSESSSGRKTTMRSISAFT